MDQLWAEYQSWLRGRFAPSAPDTSAGEVLVRAFSLSSPALTASGARWYVQGDGYTRPQLMRQAPGEKPRALRATEPDTRLAASADDGVLMAELEICRDHNLLYNLHRVDSLGRRSKLTDCERHRFAAALDDGRVAAVWVEAGDAEVVVLEHGKPVQTLYRTAPGESISGLAAKGQRVVITSLRDGRWALIDVSEATPTVLAADEAIKHSPRFGETVDEVLFIADYDKVYDVWSWQRGSPTLSRW